MPHDDFLAATILTADKLQALDEEGSYTPTLGAGTTNPNLGSTGVAIGEWNRNGHMIHVWVFFMFSGTGISSGTGAVFISPPFAAAGSLPASGSPAPATGRMILGSGYFADASHPVNTRVLSCQLWTATRIGLFAGPHGQASNAFLVAETMIGGALASSDMIQAEFSYRADPAVLP